MNKKDLLQDFRDYYELNIGRITNASTFNYSTLHLNKMFPGNKKPDAKVVDTSFKTSGEKETEPFGFLNGKHIKETVLTGVAFWKYLHRFHNGTYQNHAIRKDELKSFFDHENVFVRLISRLEVLPDEVFRKLLWRENIDFMSMESTLRRLTVVQMEAIYEAYDALYGEKPRIPKVYYKTKLDRLKIRLKLITVQTILDGNYLEPKRDETKPAWAYEFMHADFGFSLYDKGVNDDRELEDRSYKKFLSVKNHASDFAVNQEDGIYWMLYRSARSNAAWFPKKIVVLNKAICPGFWMTWLIHILLWIVSPALFIGATVFHHYYSMKVGTGWNGALWLLPLTAYPGPYLILNRLLHFVSLFMAGDKSTTKTQPDIFDRLGSWVNSNEVSLWYWGKRVVIVLAILFALFWTLVVFLGMSIIGANIFTQVAATVAVFTAGSAILLHVFGGREHAKAKRILWYCSLATFLPALEQIIMLYAWWDILVFLFQTVHFIQSIWSGIVAFAQLAVGLFLVVSISFAFLMLSLVLVTWLWSNEDRFAKYAQSVRKVCLTTSAAIILLLLKEMYTYGGQGLIYTEYGQITFLIVVMTAVMMVFIWFGTEKINEETLIFRKNASVLNAVFMKKLQYGQQVLSAEDLQSNPWLMELAGESKNYVLSEIATGLFLLFDHYTKSLGGNDYQYSTNSEIKNDKAKFVRTFIPLLTKDNIGRFKTTCAQTKRLADYFHVRDVKVERYFIFRVFEMVFVQQKSFEEAVSEVAEKQKVYIAEREVSDQKWKNAALIISTPIRVPAMLLYQYVLTPTGMFIKKIAMTVWTFISQTRQLWVLFNERCPYVHKGETIQ